MAELVHLVFHIRTARRKALNAAIFEARSLFCDFDIVIPSGGALSEEGGVFWIDIPAPNLDLAQRRMARLGYTNAVDMLNPLEPGSNRKSGRIVRWRRKDYRLIRLYEEDESAAREAAPDRREFTLETSDGQIRSIRGYRGDGKSLSRRALPVYDARILVNTVFQATQGPAFLDPFAGVGGLVIEAFASGFRTFSCDIDPALRHGLSLLGSLHCVADARCLPFADESFDAVATEPPYDVEAADLVAGSLAEIQRVLKRGKKMSMLCAEWQAEQLRQSSAVLNLPLILDLPINRKGTRCELLVWEKKM